MTRKLLLLFLLMGISLLGYSKGIMSEEKPPNAFIKINNDMYETTLGTYCWNGKGVSTCVDTAGPIELLEGKKPIKVKPGENITFVMDYTPKPNEFYVVQIHGNEENSIEVIDNSFSAPAQKGVYYYSYGVWWMDEKVEHLSNGDAFYAFALEVD
ncbi:hypothetical protein RRV45_04410 [Bacillus sp. DTU_2020_1000418_1_SI_GHA_SEK_038]|uniref:hypothetical protein n=1 Tax=Bacillus sp. DTU_2020_1000418_1_SI_GHA_SEK_038 TaxID=3077585 RepID=UPI0028EC8DA8|nr:hypothetical protein [Bacillus sp. DTU_2020_1000418_1_SI_GHA_SEK_038]WNS76257.1 hypothetical protein RRV45_04410 [Bacillus sp. DTU_2020_1000418_1_SI_GHA_SEK_038]